MDWVLPITGIIAMLFLTASMFMDDHHDFIPLLITAVILIPCGILTVGLTPESEAGCRSIRPHRFRILLCTMMCGAVEEI